MYTSRCGLSINSSRAFRWPSGRLAAPVAAPAAMVAEATLAAVAAAVVSATLAVVAAARTAAGSVARALQAVH